MLTMKIRALIADDEPLGRSLIRNLLAEDPDFVCVRECADGAEALRAIQHAGQENPVCRTWDSIRAPVVMRLGSLISEHILVKMICQDEFKQSDLSICKRVEVARAGWARAPPAFPPQLASLLRAAR